MPYLLDTCVISELVAKIPDPRVVRFVDGLDSDETYLSVITVGEIRKGIEKLAASRKRTQLERWFRDQLLVRFGGRIASIDLPVVENWGSLLAATERRGFVMPAVDSLIAAVALTHDLTLVTRNERDFQPAGIRLINPWA